MKTEIHLYYNYYIVSNTKRQYELDYCFNNLLNNTCLKYMYVDVRNLDYKYCKSIIDNNTRNVILTTNSTRPTFKHIIDKLNSFANDNTINIIINSDCYIDNNTTDYNYLNNIKINERFCISRYEALTHDPLVINNRVVYPYDKSQDAWIFKGKLKNVEQLYLDFTMGKPGCDNRLAYEFTKFNNQVKNPASKIKIIHYHRDNKTRTYTRGKDTVSGPYFCPKVE